MNANSYLSLSHHPALLQAADEAARVLRRGPRRRAVHRRDLEPPRGARARIAAFTGRPAAKAFNSAYTTILGTAIALPRPDTFWIGDALNHNCIIRAMRIANVPSDRTRHLHAQRHGRPGPPARGRARRHRPRRASFSTASSACAATTRRSPDLLRVLRAARATASATAWSPMMDDSPRHRRVRRDGARDRGVLRHAGRHPGRHLRQGLRRERRLRRRQPRAGRGGAAEGRHLHLHEPAGRGRLRRGRHGRRHRRRPRGTRAARQPGARGRGSSARGWTRSGSSRSPARTRWCRCSSATPTRCAPWCAGLFERGILAVGLTFPVVPQGDETIRFQVNAAHTEADIVEVLAALDELK